MGKRRFMTILDKMIVVDLIKTLTAVLSVIVVIIVSRQFMRVLDKAIEGQVANETILIILGLKIIAAASEIFPVAVFMSVLIVLGRMSRDLEIDALSAAGAGIGMMYRSVFLAVIPLCLVAAWMALFSAPWAEETIQRLILEDRQAADIRGVSAGRFSEYQHGNLVFYVESISENGQMRDIFVQDKQHEKLGIITADSGELRVLPGGQYLVLKNGERIQGEPGRVDLVIEKFNEYAVRIEARGMELSLDRDAEPTRSLWNSSQLPDIAEMQRRISIPLGILLLSAMAIPLAKIAPRGGVYGSLLTAFLIYFCFANLQRVSNSLVTKGVIPIWSGYIGIYILMLFIVILLLIKLYGLEWFKMNLQQRSNW